MPKITKTAIAQKFGISPQAVAQKAKRMNISDEIDGFYQLLSFYFKKYDSKNKN